MSRTWRCTTTETRVERQAEKGIPAPTLVGGGRQEGPDVGQKELNKVEALSPKN